MAGGEIFEGKPTQSTLLTCIFAFNLIVGVGALALPYAFNSVGFVLGCILLSFVGFLGFVTLTFVLEAIANTSALVVIREPSDDQNTMTQSLLKSSLGTQARVFDTTEKPTYSDLFQFTHLEMSQLSKHLFPIWGQNLFYVVICFYLYGDLAIYGCAVPKTLSDFTGVDYNIFLAGFSALMVPFAFMNFSKTKYLQIATLATRNIALLTMIVLTIKFIAEGKGSTNVEYVKPSGISVAWGGLIYAFMCHHSLPSIVTPMKDKSKAVKSLFFTFILVAFVYTSLSVSAVFAFSNLSSTDCPNHPGDACQIKSLYTLNFSSFDVEWLAKFLTLFPVFTLTSNFPMISITLRNNLVTLFQRLDILNHSKKKQFLLCAILSPCPPLLVSFAVHDVSMLVGITGAYGGMFIMFIIPTLFVRISRQQLELYLGVGGIPDHSLRSPFRSKYWEYGVLLWSVVSLGIITASYIMKAL
eukprot:c15807_g1_i1.p1 GENE.c15807_g1_i1~~c15807_g1_i1.p1  ORF type:complete len:469 (+),score=175.67 c15807_g1_i1:40-1446(+)